MSFDNGSASSKPTWNSNNLEIKLYAKNRIKVYNVKEEKNIVKIIISIKGKGAGGKKNNVIPTGFTASVGNGTENEGEYVWTGDPVNEVTLTLGGTAGHYKITKITVEYNEDVAHSHVTTDTENIVAHDPTAATCGTKGNSGTYYTCNLCEGKYFVPESEGSTALVETTIEEVFDIPVSGEHSYTDVVLAVEATCTSEGNLAYKTCSVCGKYFIEQEEVWTAVEQSETVVAKKAHSYAEDGMCIHGCGTNVITEAKKISDTNAKTALPCGKVTLNAIVTTAGKTNIKLKIIGKESLGEILGYNVQNCAALKVNDKIKITGLLYNYRGDAEFKSDATYTLIPDGEIKLTESIVANTGSSLENGQLILKSNGTFDVVYTIDSATGAWGLVASAKTNACFKSVKMTIGEELKDLATLTGEEVSVSEEKLAATGLDNITNKVLVTITYTLADGVTSIPEGAYGLNLTVVGADEDITPEITSSDVSIVVVKTTEILVDEKVTYTGSAITVGQSTSEVKYDIEVVTDHTGYMTATWFDSEGNELAAKDVVNAGTYKLKVSFAANGIYAAQEETFEVTVNKATLTVVSISAKNGNARKPIKNGSASWTTADFGVTVSGLLGDDKLEGTMVITAPTAPEALTLNTAGTLDVSLKYTLTSANYKFATADNVTENTVTGTVTVEAYSKGIKIEGKPSVDGDYYYDTGIDFSTLYVYDITDESKTRLENVTFKITIRQDGMEDIVVEGEQAKTYVLRNAGTYIITIEASATIDNDTYTDISENNEYTINKLNLTNIVLDYKTDGKVTWSAPKYYTTDPADAKDLNTLTGVTANITYKVNDGEPFAATEYAPTATADSLTIAVLCDNANFNLPEAVITKAVVKVTFIDEKHTEEGTGTATQYRFVGQKATQPTPAPEFVGWTFAGWYLADETATFDFANRAVNESITLTAKWTENLVQCTITVINVYNGETDGTTGTTLGTTVEGKKPLNGVEELTTIALTKFVKVEGYYSDAACTLLITEVPNKATATIYAKYVLALGNGDINGDKTVDNNDIVLYRKYIVGGYDIEVIGIGDEYTAAVLYADDTETKFFFKAVANVNGDKTTEGEIQTDVYDIRDAAVLAMAMVNANGYGVSEDNTHITTPSDSTNASASTSTQAVQYALLPTGKYAA